MIRFCKKLINIPVILVMALGLRLTALALGFAPKFPDSTSYFDAGKTFFATGVVKSDLAMPLYPIVSYMLGGEKLLIGFDIILSVATVATVYGLTKTIFEERRIALFAAVATAIYPYFIFYSISRLTETLFIFLLTTAFLAYYRRYEIIGHILLVTSVLVRPSLDLLAPILVFAFARFVHRYGMKRSILQLTGYCVVYALLMTPWWLHNYEKYGEFVRLNLGYGVVLYSGNNPMNKSGGGITGIDFTDDVVTGVSNPIKRNQIFVNAAFDYIKANPLEFVENAFRKLARFWRLWPYAPQWVSFQTIAISLLSYGVVLFLAVLSLFRLNKAQIVSLAPVFILIIYLTSVHMVTIGSIRYRLPLEPFLIILASYFCAHPRAIANPQDKNVQL